MDLEELVKKRQRALEQFLADNWEVFRPRVIEDHDDVEINEGGIFTGAVLVIRSFDPVDDVEVTLKVRTPGLGFSEQLGLLHTTLLVMETD